MEALSGAATVRQSLPEAIEPDSALFDELRSGVRLQAGSKCAGAWRVTALEPKDEAAQERQRQRAHHQGHAEVGAGSFGVGENADRAGLRGTCRQRNKTRRRPEIDPRLSWLPPHKYTRK